MKELFNKLFARKKSNVETREKSPLEILAYSISDVGLFTWYSADLPKYAQLEFNRTMLYFEQKDTDASPSNQIALQFGNIKSVHIYQDAESNLPENWLELLTEDKLESFDVNYEYFSFEANQIRKMISEFSNPKKVFGEELKDISTVEKFQIGFKAGEISMVIVAENMRIMTHAGEVEIGSIPEIHNNWWGYWRKYWALRESSNQLPYDPLCEITIPAGKIDIP